MMGYMTSEDTTKAIGENFRRIRTEAGWTMVDLAKEMKRHGFNWTKVSIYKIETGERQLKVNEAIAAFSVMSRDVNESLARLTEVTDADKQARAAIDETLRGIRLMLVYGWGKVSLDGRCAIKSIIGGKEEWDDHNSPEDKALRPSEEMVQRLREVEAATDVEHVIAFLKQHMRDFSQDGLDRVDVIDGELCGFDSDGEQMDW